MILGAITAIILLAGLVFCMDCVIVRKQLGAYRESLRRQGQRLSNRELFGSFTAEELARGSNLVVICRSLSGVSDRPRIDPVINSNGHVFCYSKLPSELLFPPIASSTNPPILRRRSERGAAVWHAPTMVDNTNGWKNIAQQLASQRETIEKLASAMEGGQIGVAVEDHDYGTNSIHLIALDNPMMIIRDAVIVHLHEGEFNLAHRETMTLLRMLKLMHVRRDEIHGITRPFQAAFIGSWECLQYPFWNDSQLSELQSAWEALDFLQSMEMQFLYERNTLGPHIEYSRHHWPFRCMCDLMDDFDSPGRAFMSILDHGEYDLLYGRFPYYWDWIARRSFRDEYQGLEHYQFWLEVVANLRAAKLTAPSLSKICTDHTSLHDVPSNDCDLDAWVDNASVAMELKQALAYQAMEEMVVISIALRRYQSEHAAYPSNLADLSPKYLTKMPMDPAIGQPFKYALDQTNGYRLYSVGLDGTDEGGMSISNPFLFWKSSLSPSPGGPKGSNWVWPHPVTTEEVAAALELRKNTRQARDK